MSTTKSRMQILHVVHSLEPGGTERMLCRLVSALDGQNADHIICSLRDPRPFEGTLGDGLKVVSLSARPRDRFLYRRLADLVRQRNIDIVHARNWGTWTDADLACKSVPRVQLLLGFHGLQNGKSFTTFQRIRAKLLNLTALPVTTVSNSARQVLVDSLGFKKSNVRVIPNGVDLTRFEPTSKKARSLARSAWNLPESDLIIGSVANFFERVKGHDVLLNAFAEVFSQEPNTRLLLVGYGPLEHELRTKVSALGIEQCVTFAGRTDRVETILPAFDINVCSSHSEGMSNALLEAMATGLACVVTDVSDHRHMFGEIDPQLIVPANQPKRMASTILRLATNETRRQDVGRSVRKLVEQDYTFEVCSESYRRSYDQLMGVGFKPRSAAWDEQAKAPDPLAIPG